MDAWEGVREATTAYTLPVCLTRTTGEEAGVLLSGAIHSSEQHTLTHPEVTTNASVCLKMELSLGYRNKSKMKAAVLCIFFLLEVGYQPPLP